MQGRPCGQEQGTSSSAVYTGRGRRGARPGCGTHLRMHSRAWVKTCGAMPCSCCRIRHCSSVTDMAVRSLALLQLVNRTPLRRRQICQQKHGPCLEARLHRKAAPFTHRKGSQPAQQGQGQKLNTQAWPDAPILFPNSMPCQSLLWQVTYRHQPFWGPAACRPAIIPAIPRVACLLPQDTLLQSAVPFQTMPGPSYHVQPFTADPSGKEGGKHDPLGKPEPLSGCPQSWARSPGLPGR